MELTDDCLILVFHHLSLFERVKTEQVCRKWRSLMPYNDISTLDLAKDVHWPQNKAYICSISAENQHFTVGLVEREFFPAVVLENLLLVVLKRCGAFLKELVAGMHHFRHPIPIFHAKAMQYIAALCPNLTTFHLRQSYLHDTCMGIFVNAWAKLQYLDMSCIHFLTEDNVKLMGNFQGIQDSFHHFLTAHTHLEELHLSGLPFIPKVANPKLRVLDLSYAKVVDNEVLINVTDSCRELKILKLAYCHGITDFAPIGNLQNLEELSLTHTLLSNEALATICQNCQNISKLDMSIPWYELDGAKLTNLEPLGLLEKLSILNVDQVRSFNSHCLYEIAKHGMIEELHAGWSSVTNEGIKNLVAFCCQKLTVVDLKFSKQLSDEGIVFLVEKCKNLQVLNVSGCKATNEVLACVGSVAECLEELGIYHCDWINECGFQQLYQHRKLRIEGGESLPQLEIQFHDGVVPEDLVKNLNEFCKVEIYVR